LAAVAGRRREVGRAELEAEVPDVVELRRGACGSKDPARVLCQQLLGAAFEVLAPPNDPIRFVPHHIFGIVLGDDRSSANRVGLVEDLEEIHSHQLGRGSGHGESIRVR